MSFFGYFRLIFTKISNKSMKKCCIFQDTEHQKGIKEFWNQKMSKNSQNIQKIKKKKKKKKKQWKWKWNVFWLFWSIFLKIFFAFHFWYYGKAIHQEWQGRIKSRISRKLIICCLFLYIYLLTFLVFVWTPRIHFISLCSSLENTRT